MRDGHGYPHPDPLPGGEGALVVEALVGNHRRFLAFLERRVGSRALAGVPEVAQEAVITPNNAGVRLHRARQALKKQLRHLRFSWVPGLYLWKAGWGLRDARLTGGEAR